MHHSLCRPGFGCAAQGAGAWTMSARFSVVSHVVRQIRNWMSLETTHERDVRIVRDGRVACRRVCDDRTRGAACGRVVGVRAGELRTRGSKRPLKVLSD
eukprot:4929193-Prymnesium_polylepis.1